jgi:hypothetical protein
MIKSVILFLMLFPFFIQAQIYSINRLEVETRGRVDVFTLLPHAEGVVGFRVSPEKKFNIKYLFEFFTTDLQLSSSPIIEIPIRDYHELIGYDKDGDKFYAFFIKIGSSEKYLLEIDINTLQFTTTDLQKLLYMEYIEFLVSNNKAIFAGISDSKPILQAYDLADNSIYTFPEIYSKEQQIIQVRKVPDFGMIDVTVSKRDRLRKKQISLISFDETGNKIRQVNVDKITDEHLELIEAFATPYQSYQNALVGTYGLKRREEYYGNYILSINEFGEYKIDYYNLKDYPNFFSYLDEKARNKKQKELQKYHDKETQAPIRPIFTLREIVENGPTRLIYNETFSGMYSRNSSRDGFYQNNMYRISHSQIFQNINYLENTTTYRVPTQNLSLEGEYKYTAAHFALIHEDGRVLWDTSLQLPQKTKIQPFQFGQISFDGENLFFLYLEENQIAFSHIKNGEIISQDQLVEMTLINPNERVKDFQEGSLNLLHWYDDYFICSGTVRIRSLNEEGKEVIREVFFLDKIQPQPHSSR